MRNPRNLPLALARSCTEPAGSTKPVKNLRKRTGCPPRPTPRLSNPAYTWFFLAMTHHRLGHADEAKQWLDKARAETDNALDGT